MFPALKNISFGRKLLYLIHVSQPKEVYNTSSKIAFKLETNFVK